MSGSPAYRIKLDTFEGPMDLLVHLVRKNDVDIYDIPISLITREFYTYIQAMETLNIEFAGEFLIMAATLSHIKSRMLLPACSEEDEEEDPRLEIARPLLEYLQLKEAAEQLNARDLLGRDTFLKGHDEGNSPADDPTEIDVSAYDLAIALSRMLNGQYQAHKVELTIEQISIKERMIAITAFLEDKSPATFIEILCLDIRKNNVIATFLALLELGKLSLIRLSQNIQSGEIRIFYN